MKVELTLELKREAELDIACGYFSGDGGAYVPLYCDIYGRVDGDLALTDEQIKYLTKDGQRIAWACIKRYGCRGLDHEELHQECLIAIAKALKCYDPSRVETKLSTYIWVCCENRVKMALRKSSAGQAKYERYGRRPAWMIPLEKFRDPNMDGFEEWDLRRSRHEWLDKALNDPKTGLTEQERMVIQLTGQGLPQIKIGLIIGLCQSDVSKRKSTAMAKLQTALAQLRAEGPCALDDLAEI